MQVGDIVKAAKPGKGKWALPINTEAKIVGEGGWGSWKLNTLAGKVHYAKPSMLMLVANPSPDWAKSEKPVEEDPPLTFQVVIMRTARSKKAQLVSVAGDPDGRTHWMPVSQCDGLPAKRNETLDIKVPVWLAEKKGIKHLAKVAGEVAKSIAQTPKEVKPVAAPVPVPVIPKPEPAPVEMLMEFPEIDPIMDLPAPPIKVEKPVIAADKDDLLDILF